ncbi:MAG: AraC family transcriptional regulator [Bacteroidota bacterium]
MASSNLDRIQRVLDYIHTHLQEPLPLEVLAEVGGFSSFHFHRLLRGYLGEPVGSYVKRLRLEKSATLLTYSDLPAADIAYQVGYETPSAFTTAFHKHFGLSPVEFRKQRSQPKETATHQTPQGFSFEPVPELVTLHPQRLGYLQVRGTYGGAAMGQAWGTLHTLAGQLGWLGPGSLCIGISYENPELSSTDQWLYHACISIKEEIQPPEPIQVKLLPGGRYARFRYQGPHEYLDLVYDKIFKDWLLPSHHHLRDADIFDIYHNTQLEVAPAELITEIHIPISPE